MIFSNLEVTTNPVTLMKIKPLIQLREMISKALSGQANLSKSFQSFFIETHCCPLKVVDVVKS